VHLVLRTPFSLLRASFILYLTAILINMEQEIKTKLEEQGAKIDAILESVEKTRKYFLTTMWITILVIVIPTIGLIFVIPAFLNSYLAPLAQ